MCLTSVTCLHGLPHSSATSMCAEGATAQTIHKATDVWELLEGAIAIGLGLVHQLEIVTGLAS